MTKSANEQPQPPHGHRDRGVADEPISKKAQTKTDASRSHDPEAAEYEAEKKTFEPDRDGSGS